MGIDGGPPGSKARYLPLTGIAGEAPEGARNAIPPRLDELAAGVLRRAAKSRLEFGAAAGDSFQRMDHTKKT